MIRVSRGRAAGVLLALVFLAALELTACGGGSKKNGDAPVASTLTVSLKEWSIEASAQQVKPGKVTFQVTNNGTLPHDFVVIKSDLPPDQLPIDAAGRVVESKVNVLGSVHSFAPGSMQTLSLDLTPGKYLLICNLVDPAGQTPVSHYANGMVASLLVSS